MAFTITMPNKEFNLIQGDLATKQLVVEITSSSFAESVETKLKLTDKAGSPLLFTDVFETITAKNTYDNFTMDVLTSVPDGSEVVLNSMYALQAETSEVYEISYTLKAEFIGLVNLSIETIDTTTSETISDTSVIRVATLVEALEEYEEQIVKMNDLDVAELEASYQELETKRVLVHAALSGLAEDETKTALMTRYWKATDLQYTSYKMLLLNLSANNRLDLTAVKNIGGNSPYQVAFRDKVLVGSATQAIRFYPEGFLPVRTGNAEYSSNFPEDISSTVLVGQDKLTLPSLTVPEGYEGELNFLDLYKIAGTWYRLPYEYAEVTAGEEPELSAIVLSTVDGHDVLVTINQGEEYKTAVEEALVTASQTAVFNGEMVSAQDAESELSFKTTLTHPIYTSAVPDSFTLDYLVTSSVAFPEGLEVTVSQNELNLGTIQLKAGDTQFYLSEIGLGGVNKEQLNFRTGTDTLEFLFEGYKPGTLQLTAQAIVAEEGEHKIPTSLYSFGQYTAEVQLLDRRGALEHAVANTELVLTGDAIETVEEGIALTMTATYPEFHSELDPELKVDTLFTFDQALTAGAKVDITLNSSPVGSYTVPAEETVTQLWLSDILENLRPALVDNKSTSVEYVVTLSGINEGLYSLDSKLVTAKDGSFDIVAARTVLASVVTPLELTDKSELNGLISQAEQLLVTHIEGSETGNASALDREALQTAIDTAYVTKNDDDATINDLNNAEVALTAAIAAFKDSVVKIKIDKVALNQVIADAQALLDTVQVGNQVGNTSNEAKGTLQDAVDAATNVSTTLPDFVSVFDTEDTTQEQIDAAAVVLTEAIATFNATIITDTQYVDARLTEYETAAKDFYDNLRLKLNI